MEAGATAILTGEPVKEGGTGTNYVIPSADAEPLTSAPTFWGIAASDSDETAALDGNVDVIVPGPGMVFEASAKSAAAADTEAEINALRNDLILLDLTSSTYTVDTASTNSANGLKVVGGDHLDSKIWFVIRSGATVHA